MNSTLIRLDGAMPPGGYAFIDRITGKHYTDTHTFFNDRVRQIVNDRMANHRLFTDERLVDELNVAKELSEYTCARLRGNPKFCGVGNNTPISKAFKALSLKVCPHCGSTELDEILCKTCSGRRVTGYTCKSCKKKISL